MSNNHIIKFLRLKEVKVINVENHKDNTILTLRRSKPKPDQCPHCGYKYLHYHDKRFQRLRDIPYNHQSVFFDVERVRYLCPNCEKKTGKNPDFLIHKSQITIRLFF